MNPAEGKEDLFYAISKLKKRKSRISKIHSLEAHVGVSV